MWMKGFSPDGALCSVKVASRQWLLLSSITSQILLVRKYRKKYYKNKLYSHIVFRTIRDYIENGIKRNQPVSDEHLYKKLALLLYRANSKNKQSQFEKCNNNKTRNRCTKCDLFLYGKCTAITEKIYKCINWSIIIKKYIKFLKKTF